MSAKARGRGPSHRASSKAAWPWRTTLTEKESIKASRGRHAAGDYRPEREHSGLVALAEAQYRCAARGRVVGTWALELWCSAVQGLPVWETQGPSGGDPFLFINASNANSCKEADYMFPELRTTVRSVAILTLLFSRQPHCLRKAGPRSVGLLCRALMKTVWSRFRAARVLRCAQPTTAAEWRTTF